MKLGIAVLSIPVVLYVGLCVLLYSRQRAFMYFPTPESSGRGAESMRVESAGESLHVRRIHAGRPQALLYFGGNGEDVAQNVPDFQAALPQYTVYFVHYRGYGGSSGSPTERGLFDDALNVYDHVRDRHRSVSAIGRSLGSGVALHLATHRELEKLVLVTPYDSIEGIVRRVLPIFPVSILLQDKYRSIDRAPGISIPTLVLIAERDEVIPRASTDRLVAAFDPSRVVTHVLEDATHNTLGEDPGYLSRLREFLAGDAPPPRPEPLPDREP